MRDPRLSLTRRYWVIVEVLLQKGLGWYRLKGLILVDNGLVKTVNIASNREQ